MSPLRRFLKIIVNLVGGRERFNSEILAQQIRGFQRNALALALRAIKHSPFRYVFTSLTAHSFHTVPENMEPVFFSPSQKAMMMTGPGCGLADKE